MRSTMTTSRARGDIIPDTLNGLSGGSWRQTRGDRTSSPITGSKSGVAILDFCNTALVIGGTRAVGVAHVVDDGHKRKWWKILLQKTR